MSKDKGSKNHKKAPADKSPGKGKDLSAYQSENKRGHATPTTLDAFVPKTDTKTSGNKKS